MSFWTPVRLLLDECVPKRLGLLLDPHNVQTVPQVGWSGLKNGELLAKAAESFDVFVTVRNENSVLLRL